MTTPANDAGYGMAYVPELLVRQVLIEGLMELAGDEDRMNELFGRVDSMLQGSQGQWLKDLKAMTREMAERDSRGPAHVRVGYPADDALWPHISIVIEGGSEDAGQATLGDVLGVEYEQRGEPDPDDDTTSRSIRHKRIGVGWTTNLQVGTWAVSPEMSVVVHALVKHLLVRHKTRLSPAGIHEITLSENGFAPDPVRWPRIGYVPYIRCTMIGTLRQTRRTGQVPTRVTVSAVRGGSASS